jgi:hypothetical protein
VKKFRDEHLYDVEHKRCLPETQRYGRVDFASAH